MQTKTINILYWVFTIIFAALMLFSAYDSILVGDASVKLIHEQLGYPVYFIFFTGIGKLIGVIIILIPGLKTVKEWAYAGLFLDLFAAIYSGVAVAGKFDPMMVFMLIWVVPGILSYVFWKKKMAAGLRS